MLPNNSINPKFHTKFQEQVYEQLYGPSSTTTNVLIYDDYLVTFRNFVMKLELSMTKFVASS